MEVMKRQERKILQRRRRLQCQERCTHRRKNLNLIIEREEIDRVAIEATTLADIEALTSRPGFIRQQLTMKGMTALRRWYLQLKLIVAEDSKSTMADRNDDMETALQACEKELLRDQRCCDVVYRAGARVSDVRESLLDVGAPMDVRELLIVSTRVDSFICRVTCVHDGKHVLFISSEYIEHLQAELERFLYEDTPVDAVISFIWKALKAHQVVK
ncbi:unnamed protein product [Peronospora belbahrii]|uniref:Uncharacterized protein n=1 Tax=Peronospora belbahrii TaxID=622444 RepID=A0AAU9L0S3_9STRA|nr:unnamed protein product [Peronospora belbahrii]